MTEIGKSACQAWAQDFEQRHGTVRDPQQLRELYSSEARVPNAENGAMRRAMAQLEFSIFVTVLVNFTSHQISKQKVREVQAISGAKVTRREYWNLLDRAYYFMAGMLTLTDQAA